MSDAALRQFLLSADLPLLMQRARDVRDLGHGGTQTYSRKVFIPLTKLCRDVCAYCTFAQTPRAGQPCYLDREAVLAIARAGAKAGCHEALFTLGDKPELRCAAARDELARLGHDTTLGYLAEVCELVATETGLLPHVNAGVMGAADIARLRKVSVSQGLMLESVSDRLCERGGPHFGSPDKAPAARLETIRLAGELAVPFTTGILVGIGETREERIDSLIAIRDLHQRYGHIQEVIVQNFRAKADTRMARHAEPDFDDFLWSVAVARLVLGPSMSIQAPPNLSPHGLGLLPDAGINDWGGISPITVDHVNPEAAWPQISALAEHAAAQGRVLVPRLAVYPDYIRKAGQWIDPALVGPLLRASDAEQFARDDAWAPGMDAAPPSLPFVPMEAPILARGGSRRGPTFREAVLTHAVARLVLNPVIPNIQVSWVKMGPQGVRACLDAGVNDLGGTLMDESISRAAGSRNGQELTPAAMERLIRDAGRSPRQRTTLYGEPDVQRQQLARKAAPLHVPIQAQAYRPSISSSLVEAGEASQHCSQRMTHVDQR